MSSQLFDPDEFRSSDDSGRELRQRRGSRPLWLATRTNNERAVPSDGSWVIVTSTSGVLDDCHRVDHANEFGSVVTKCNRAGRVLDHPVPGTLVIPCRKCEEATP